MKVIDYLPQKDAAQIVFTKARVDAKKLEISKRNYEDRKKNHIEKKDAVLDYVTRKSKCRSQMLLAYFGEYESKRCGVCDVCIERNKMGLSDLEFSNVKEQVKSLLAKNVLTLKEIIPALTETTEDNALKVVQWLIDNGKVLLKDDNSLHYKE